MPEEGPVVNDVDDKEPGVGVVEKEAGHEEEELGVVDENPTEE